MNTMNLIFAVPIILAMLRELDGYAIETSEEANEKIGLHEISDRAACDLQRGDFDHTRLCTRAQFNAKIQCSHYLMSGHRCDFTCSQNSFPASWQFVRGMVWKLNENQAHQCKLLYDLGILV